MSDLVISLGGTGAVTAASSFSSTSSSTFSASSSSSSSKVVKQSTSSSKVVSSSSTSTSSKSSNVSIKSSGQSYKDRMAGDFGLDISKEMDRLKLKMNEEFSTVHRDMFSLKPSSPQPIDAPAGGLALGGGIIDESLVRLDADSIRSCIDKNHGDRLKLNFDVNEYESESISVKTVGNKIEVHAQKKSKKGDEERSEEFSRVYELPTANDVDPTKVMSSIYQDGVLTIELPVSEALQQ